MGEIEQLREENARLRAALQRIVEVCSDEKKAEDGYKYARMAGRMQGIAEDALWILAINDR